MNKRTIDIKLGEILYWLFFFSLFFAKGIGLYDGQTVFKLILVFATICLGLKLCIEKYTLGEYFRIIMIVGLTCVTYLSSGEKGLLLCGMMMIGMKYVDVKRLLAIGTVIWGASFFLITITSLFRMEDTVFKVHDKLGLGHIFRWSLGYPHPNVLHVSYFILAILIIYVIGEAFKPKHAIGLFIGNCIVFMYSVSYTGFIIFMVLILGRLYLYYRKRLCIVEKVGVLLIFPVCVLLSLLAPVTIKGRLFIFLNRLLSTRMELGWRYLKPENFTLFGLRVAEITDANLTMDNSYLFAFIAYGIIPFLILCFGVLYAVVYFLKRDKYMEILIITAIAIGGLTEPFLFNTSFKNIAFVFGGALLFENTCEKREYSLASKWNKNIKVPMGKLAFVEAFLKKSLSAQKMKYLAGIIGAILVCICVQFAVIYPKGYVVYQKDCADINSDVKEYYNPENPVYADYKCMGHFEQNDVIEYFSGNIVMMERARNLIISIVIGYAVGYAVGGCIEWKKEKK